MAAGRARSSRADSRAPRRLLRRSWDDPKFGAVDFIFSYFPYFAVAAGLSVGGFAATQFQGDPEAFYQVGGRSAPGRGDSPEG